MLILACFARFFPSEQSEPLDELVLGVGVIREGV